jgi:hypothetical protein
VVAEINAGERVSVGELNDRLMAEGHWVFAAGLAALEEARVIDNRGEKPIVTDGPFLESKEFLGGFWVLDFDNHQQALEIATEASRRCNRRIEVRRCAED